MTKIEKNDNPMALLLKDLSIFQKNMSGAKKDSKNPFHKSTYADLSSVISAIQEYSKDVNLGFFHVVEDNILITTLFYSDGVNYAEMKSSLSINIENAKNLMQAKGSAITYAKRYTLQGLYGLPSEDDDGQSCQGVKLSTQKIETLEEISKKISKCVNEEELRNIYSFYKNRNDINNIANLCANQKQFLQLNEKNIQDTFDENNKEVKNG